MLSTLVFTSDIGQNIERLEQFKDDCAKAVEEIEKLLIRNMRHVVLEVLFIFTSSNNLAGNAKKC